MDTDRLRVLALTLVYVVLAVVSGIFLDWFVLEAPGGGVTLDLRNATACNDGKCASVALGSVPGLGPYVYGSWLTFWGTMVLSLLVLFQAFTRIFTGFAHPKLSRMGVLAGMSMAASAAATGFVLTPDVSPMSDVLAVMMMSFERTSAPVLLVVAHVAGIAALHYAAHETTRDNVGEYKPVVLARPAAEGARPAPAPGAEPSAGPSFGPSAALPRAQVVPRPNRTSVSGPLALFPAHLRKRLKFVALSAELTRAGLDARREDGSSLLVMWRDVVGVIARRLPPELDGETFVDVVSTAGSTLRVMAWTRLAGEPVLGEGDARARAFITFVAASCPEARLDPATRAFVDHELPAEQIATEDALAVYDARLA